MKIAEAVKKKESPLLIRLRKIVKESPADSIYSAEELAAEIGCTHKHTHMLLSEKEFQPCRVRDGRRFLYGSEKSVAAFLKARKAQLNED